MHAYIKNKKLNLLSIWIEKKLKISYTSYAVDM